MHRTAPILLTLLGCLSGAAARGEELAALVTTPDAPWRVRLPEENRRETKLNADWTGVAFVEVEARIAGTRRAPPVRLAFEIVNARGELYQSARPVLLRPQASAVLRAGLGAGSADLVPAGHFRPWSPDAAGRVRRVGLALYGERPWAGEVEVLSVRLVPGAEARPGAREFRAVDLVLDPPARYTGARAAVRFRLLPEPANPFDSEVLPVEVAWTDPDGRETVAPAFFDQDFVRRGRELMPARAGRFAAWGLPGRAGRYTVAIRVRGEEVGAFPVAVSDAVSESTRVPAKEERTDLSFAAAGGERFVEPLNVAATATWAEWKGGRFAAASPPAGASHAWTVPIEWTSRWGRWEGLGRYDLAMAWRFERVLDEAARRGVALPLSVLSDGPFFESGKYRWSFNPLAGGRPGGFLAGREQFFSEPRAWRAFANRARYLAARFATHPAVAGLAVTARIPAAGAAEWHERCGELLAAATAGRVRVASAHPQAASSGRPGRLGSFESAFHRAVWRVDKRLTPGAVARPAREAAREGEWGLAITARFPGEVCVARPVDHSFWRYRYLSFEARLPADAPRDVRVQVYVRDPDESWFEQLLELPLRPGEWTRLLADLSPEAPWTGRGHGRPWDGYGRARLREVGLRFFSGRPWSGTIALDNVLALGREEAPRGPTRIVSLEPVPKEVPRFGRLEVRFDLSRAYENPFDPDVVDVRGRFLAPSGRVLEVPAFFDKPFARSKAADGAEVLTPSGPALWRLRFAPDEAGPHRLDLVVREGKEGRIVAERKGLAFTAVEAGLTGFVRVAPDGRHFELSTGESFYPIGVNLRSPSDRRDLGRDARIRADVLAASRRGTYQYDDYFEKLSASGANWARVWMCSWWCGLEWDRRWPNYQGPGRYNLANAWRMDHLVEEATKRGVYLQVCSTNHGQLSPKIDREWDFHPYNRLRPVKLTEPKGARERRPAGFLSGPGAFFTDARAARLYRNRLRYIAARWGYATHVMSWALLSEAEFTEPYWSTAYRGRGACDVLARWHREAGRYLHQIDPRHLVTTHFSHPQRGREVWPVRELDYVQSNAYSTFKWLGGGMKEGASVGAPVAIRRYHETYMARWERPVLIGEWGGHWMTNSRAGLDAELHTGLWASATSGMAGATGYWWWPHVHFRDRYGEFRALAAFMAGEDRRGRKAQAAELHARAGSDELKAMGLVFDGRALDAYVYHPSLVRSIARKPLVKGGKLVAKGLVPGTYRVEFWSTWKGKAIGRAKAKVGGAGLGLALPEFKGDLAIKVRPVGGRAPAPAPAHPAPSVGEAHRPERKR